MDTDKPGGKNSRPKKSGGFRLFGFRKGRFENVSEEEIVSMVDAGEKEGVIEESQKEMISNILEFNDLTVDDVMTHRVDLVAVEEQDDILTAVKLAMESGFSRIPIYQEDIDNITGILYAKDLLALIGCEDLHAFSIKQFSREALYVPESAKCQDLFKKFTEQKLHMAVVVDEYGGTAGIVTMEDLVESIVGNIQDEYDDEQEEIQKVGESAYILTGSADLDDLSEELDIEIEPTQDYDTLGGFMVARLGRIPNENEHPVVVEQGYEFIALVVKERHIAKIKATRLAAKPGPDNDLDQIPVD